MNYKTFFIVLFTSFFVTNCAFQSEEVIELSPQSPQLAVFAELTGNNGFSVYVVRKRFPNDITPWDTSIKQWDDSIIDIKRNQKYLFNNFQARYDIVKGAKVKVYEEGKFLTTLEQNFPPIPHFESDAYALKPGKKYQIEVTAPGFPTVMGEQTAISNIKAQAFEFKKNSFNSLNYGLLSEIIISFDDPVDESNSYACSAILTKTNNKTGKIESFKISLFKTDPISSTNDVINDRSFNGQKYNWRIGADVQPFLSDTIGKDVRLQVTFFPINNDLEKFYRTLEASKGNIDNPFIEPISPFYNLKGGAGIFAIVADYTFQDFQLK
jgi:Domain of unknown function (DUF4249)